MATRDIVPRADGEGQIGTTEKAWLSGHFKTLYTQKIENDSSGDTPDYVLSAYASWADAISTISTTVARLIVDTDATVSLDSTAPSTLMVKVYPGCVITVATTKTLTINGVFDAGLYQVFSCAGSGKVVFGSGSVSKVHPEWWATNTTPGTTDMAAAIQAALTTQMRTIITGINLIKSQISLTSLTGVEMVAGAAGELRFDTLDQGFVFTSCTGVKILGLKVAGTTGRLFMFVSSTDIYVLDNDISGVTHIPSSGPITPVYMDAVNRIWIERNYFHGNGDATSNSEEITTWTSQSSSIHVNENVIVNTGSQYGIFLNCEAYAEVRGNFINMNYITLDDDSDGYGIACYSGVGMQRIAISNNTVVRCAGCGIYVLADPSYPCREVSITGNVIYDISKTQLMTSLESAGISVDCVTGGTITGNRIRLSGRDGIGVTNSDQVTVVGNTIEDCAERGIRIRGTGHEINISSNIVQDCETYGIIQDTAGTHENIVVSNNIVRDMAEGGIYFANTTYSIISNNIVDTTGLDGINIAAGTQNLITGNRVVGVAANYIITHNATAGVVTNNNIIGNTVTTCSLTGVISRFGNQYSTGVSQGQARLSSGTVTVSTAEVVATDNIQISYCFVDGSTMGILSIGTITAGTSFVINSSSGTDSNFVFWQIVH